jgi:hypothetical protein
MGALLEAGGGYAQRMHTTRPSKHVSSYDPDAPLPGVGSIYVWELDQPDACELIEVTDVFWNGEEWWVRSKRLHYRTLVNAFYPRSSDIEHLNDLSRFWEAVTPVRQTRTPRPPTS